MSSSSSLLIKSLILASLAIIFHASYSWCANIDPNDPVAQTYFGSVRGRKYSFTSSGGVKNVVAFIGVPYARPPTGSNRFQPPSDPDNWGGDTKDATDNRVMCPQVQQRFQFTLQQNIQESEDCLYLNVYVPIPSNTNTATMPVLVYIHGGEFKYGGKDMYKPDYLLDQSMVGTYPGIIVVTINYRLGVLGFLSTDDINQPGNNGIRDQIHALRWVSQNIGYFNGNSANVTIMGHDAGGISVNMHVLSAESWPYFSAAISLGGTVFTPWAFKDNQRQQAIDFANYYKCDLQTNNLVNCLRSVDLGALIGYQRNSRDWTNNVQRFWFRPVIDKNTSSALMKDFPYYLYQSGNYKKVPYVIGFTRNEGSLEYYLQYNRLTQYSTVDQRIAFLIRPFVKTFASEDIIASAIKFQYFTRNQSRTSISSQQSPTYVGNNNVDLSNRNVYNQQTLQQSSQTVGNRQTGGTEQQQTETLIQMLGDFLYIAPSDYLARLHTTGGGRAWVFVFEYEGTKGFGTLPQDGQMGNPASARQYGVTHMDDVFYSLPNEYIPDNGVSQDRNIANTYTQLLITLTQHGMIPLSGTSVSGWQQYTSNNPSYLRMLSTPQPVAASNYNNGYRTSYADFFNDYIYELQDKTIIFQQQFPYDQYRSFQIGTWTLTGFIALIIILVIIIIVILVIRRRNNTTKLTLVKTRRQDRELDERYNEA